MVQPAQSRKDVYYALYHMRCYVRDHQHIAMPSQAEEWAQRLAQSSDVEKMRKEFYDIQERFSWIIQNQVLKSGGPFHYPSTMTNADIDTILVTQVDERPFIDGPKGSRVIFPALQKK